MAFFSLFLGKQKRTKYLSMNRQEQIQKMTEEALKSLDGAARASAKPFLLTRIRARLDSGTDTIWERACRLISRPEIAITVIALVIATNALIMITGNKPAETTLSNEQLTAADDLSANTAILFNTENPEP